MTATCYPHSARGLPARMAPSVVKALWVSLFALMGQFSAAAVSGISLVQILAGANLNNAITRTSSFLFLIGIAGLMIALASSPAAYIPLVAAWVAIAAHWSKGWKRGILLAVEDGCWIAFGILTGVWIAVVFGAISLAVLAASPAFRKVAPDILLNLSPVRH